jgi:hypothetical protein
MSGVPLNIGLNVFNVSPRSQPLCCFNRPATLVELQTLKQYNDGHFVPGISPVAFWLQSLQRCNQSLISPKGKYKAHRFPVGQ